MKLLRAGEMTGRPVVTLGGESDFQIKDVVFDADDGRLVGFTLRKHGFLSRKVTDTLPRENVRGLGADAVVVADAAAFSSSDAVADAGGGAGVIGATILTEDGRALGAVVEAILSTGKGSRVVGFEVEAAEELNAAATHVFVPLPETIAIADGRIVVPPEAREFIRDDISGFGAAVEEYRAQLPGSS